MGEHEPLLIRRVLTPRVLKPWRYRFEAGHYARLPSEVTLLVGDVVSGSVVQITSVYAHVLGHTANSAIYLQMFPNNQVPEFRLATQDGYVGLWNDPDFSGYVGTEVRWILTRSATGYQLEVVVNGIRKNLGTIASTSAFRFNTLGRGQFAGLLWDVSVNDGSVWSFPLNDGPANAQLNNRGSGGNADRVGFVDANWTRD
ncbi:hypothetical protein [Vibrio misgurnus]|uniref:hypothetical protein n=1 Tax=Vibrio misgurnus TaxID=2993714 RepID=UPI0023F98759|nr:hypothetical protein [Vibrio sp. VCS]